MKISGVLFLFLILAAPALDKDLPRLFKGGIVIQGGVPGFAKTEVDTINLMAARSDPTNEPGEPAYFGDFETTTGSPNWNGWTHQDLTRPETHHWQVSNYNQPDPSNQAAWCGDIDFEACDENDLVGGYGNGWYDSLEFRLTVPYPESGTMVTVSAALMYDSEPGYDFTRLSYRFEGHSLEDMESWDGTGTAALMESVGYLPGEYLDGTDIALYFRFMSDGTGSDLDCRYGSVGGCQVDDIDVHVVNGNYDQHFFENFDENEAPDEFGFWEVAYPGVVGDFAQLWAGLRDEDPCRTNLTPQVAFIDDGVIVPGTGGTECLTWCYGPQGFIVNTTGGLAGPEEHIHNVVISPVMDWPLPAQPGDPEYNGMILAFDAYRHEDLSEDTPGVFYIWEIRSTDADGSAGGDPIDIEERRWLDQNFVYYGEPEYFRHQEDVSRYLVAGLDEIQIRLGVYELGWLWGYDGDDGYPAPYLDNVTAKVFRHHTPVVSAKGRELAQDNFPERGSLDLDDLGSHHVRFDMARSVCFSSDMCNIPGDSLVVSVVSLPRGDYLWDYPDLHYTMDRNPVFDPFRGPWPATGTVMGTSAICDPGPCTDFFFDLPDTAFLFPGDVLHYCISAVQMVGGTDLQTTLLPADTTGFRTGLGDPQGYDPSFTVRALPSIREDGAGGFEQPATLFIDDSGREGGGYSWFSALNNLGLVIGEDYDVYYVNDPESSRGNGIGGRATHLLLAGYDNILYTSGDQSIRTIANGDFGFDGADDVGTLSDWLDLGRKNFFMTGDGLAGDLYGSGPASQEFLQQFIGASWVAEDVQPLIGNQTTPLVRVTEGNPVFTSDLESWLAFGGCEYLNSFDAVEPVGTGQKIAEFLDPAHQPDQYSFSAANLNLRNPGPDQSKIILVPVDLMFIYTDRSAPGNPLPARARLLRDVLKYFGVVGDPGEVSNISARVDFAVHIQPNPFNPATTIRYAISRPSHLKLSVFDVRGRLVKTLVDGVRPAGADQTVIWDGSDNQGAAVASGVYFYEARAAGEVKLGKMTLLK